MAALINHENAGAAAVGEAESPSLSAILPPLGKLRGFNVGRFRVSHMRTNAVDGFAHDEGGGRVALTIFSLERLLEANGNYHAGWRVTCGLHMFTLFRR
jgi:hypothetical protein